MFTGAATIAFWTGEYTESNQSAGIAFMAALACAAFLESVFDFCLGCFFFSVMVKLRIINPDPSIDCDKIAPETERTIAYLDERTGATAPESIVIEEPRAGHDGGRAVPVSYKPKTENLRREAFHLIKYMHVSDFVSAMGLAGLALSWKLATDSFYAPRHTWVALTLFAAAWFVFQLSLYFLKALLYPRKVVGEWNDINRFNFFSAIPLTLLLFSILCEGESERTMRALFWIGAPLQGFLCIVAVAAWIGGRMHRDTFSPAMMFPPVGCVVAYLAAVRVTGTFVDFPEFPMFFLAAGLVWWIVIFAGSLLRLATGGFMVPEQRHAVAFLYAAPFILSAAWPTALAPLYYFAVVAFLTVCALVTNNFLFRDAFTMVGPPPRRRGSR
jgi:tellurite resistance protein TehA-like permease